MLAIQQPSSSSDKATKHHHSKPLCSVTACDMVKASWSVISSDLESVGIDFLTRIFLDVPDALTLFPFAADLDLDELKRNNDKLKELIRSSKIIKAHARLVMREVGRCVAGLYDMTVLIPRLRSLGRMHDAAGVKPVHYDVFFRHLFDTVHDRLEAEGTWNRETAEAWLTVHDAIGAVMKSPADAVHEVEKLERWGVKGAVASFYICFVTPLRLAGLLRLQSVFWNGWMQYILNLLEFVIVGLVFATELVACVLLRRIGMADVREAKVVLAKRSSSGGLLSSLRMGIKARTILSLNRLGLQEAVTWPKTDALVLLSYVLQCSGSFWSYVYCLVPGIGTSMMNDEEDALQFEEHHQKVFHFPFIKLFSRNEHRDALPEDAPIVGIHWTQAFGLIRLVVIGRALYALRCLVVAITVMQKADPNLRTLIRICRLILALSFTSHLVACMYCLIARIQLGSECREAKSTPFFPDESMLGEENGIFGNYLKAVHFAWVNLAGIGNHESVPSTALETMFTLAVNVIGATLYAMVTGQVVAIIEPVSERADQRSDDAANLTDFMIDIGMPGEDQDRIMHGYFLRTMVGGEDSPDGSGAYASAPGLNASAPEYPEEVANMLPRHLSEELRIIALADAMRRRDRAFRRCSNEFLSALASALRSTTILLPGDYIVRQGEPSPTELLVVERGTLVVVADGKELRTLERGDMVSYHWIEATYSPEEGSNDKEGTDERQDQASRTSNGTLRRRGDREEAPPAVEGNKQKMRQATPKRAHGAFSPLLLGESVAGASLRAMEYCKLATGLSTPYEVNEFKRRFAWDMHELEETLENARRSSHQMKTAFKVTEAVVKFRAKAKTQLHSR